MTRWRTLYVLVMSWTMILASRATFDWSTKLSIQASLPYTSFNVSSSPGNFSPFNHCETGIEPPSTTHIPKYFINLDLPPEERWKELIQDKRTKIVALIESIKQNCDSLFGRNLFWMVDEFLPHLTNTLPSEYRKEIDGISREIGVSVGEITLFNVFYEFFSVCTSIVVESQDGTMYHGRNLDFGLFLGWDPVNHTWQTTSLLRPLVVELHFTQGNKTLYRAVNYAGYIGILTAMKPGNFTLSIDERFRINGGYVGLAEWILGMRNQRWIGFLAREVMEKCQTYTCAQKMLSLTPLVAPVYFILTGTLPKEGCVITRGRNSFDIWPVGQKQANQSGDWFLVQTNYDHWRKPPFYDDRRTPAIRCMDQLGNGNVSNLLSNVLSTKPILNKLTTYTALMSAKCNMLEVWLQVCPDPCWPW